MESKLLTEIGNTTESEDEPNTLQLILEHLIEIQQSCLKALSALETTIKTESILKNPIKRKGTMMEPRQETKNSPVLSC